jgi:hypothetical protein
MKNNGIIYAALVIVVLICCPVVASDNFTMQVNGVNYQDLDNPVFTWGDTIRFSGTSNEITVSVFLEDPNGDVNWKMPKLCTGLTFGEAIRPILVMPDHSWSYDWDTGEGVCKYPNVDAHIKVSTFVKDFEPFPITINAIVTPTPTPTPDYDAKIAELETKISVQETKIKAQSTRIQEIADKTPIPTTIITTKTPKPTPTIDHAAIEAALEKRLADVEAEQLKQGDFLYQIMKFLGLV